MSKANPNSNQDRLNLYIHQLHQRLRLGVSLRGAAILFATALCRSQKLPRRSRSS